MGNDNTAAYAEDAARSEGMLTRAFAAEMTPGDGRTVDVRIVPYGVAVEVSDNGLTAYREQWDRDCFNDQLVAGHRLKVLLNFEHERGIGNIVGRGVALRSMPDGLHGTFRMSDTADGDKALELVNDGILDGVSLEAVPKKSVRTSDGIVHRVRAHLHNVALCRRPAFADARVLAVRTEVVFESAVMPTEIDPELIERCRRLGIRLPKRFEAQPDEDGHPGATGTPADGTRPEGEPTTE